MDLLSISLFGLLLALVSGEECQFQLPCSCNTPSFKLDLKPLMDANNKPLETKGLGATYYLDPCGKALKIHDCLSLGPLAAGCQLEGGFPYGIAETVGYTASGDPSKGTVVFSYSYGNERKTKLHVKCGSSERKFVFNGEHPVETYNFDLETKYACKDLPGKGLSTGSILCITFFVLLFVYVVGGLLFLKYYKKEEGIDIVPNHTFWSELPYFIKDGVVFVYGKIRGESTYSKI